MQSLCCTVHFTQQQCQQHLEYTAYLLLGHARGADGAYRHCRHLLLLLPVLLLLFLTLCRRTLLLLLLLLLFH
jgi:hypothetical protein